VPRDRLDPPPPSEVRSSRHDDDRRGRREHRGDTWSSRLLHSLSHAPRERERERSESRRGSRRHRSPEHGGRRRHSSASNDPAGADNMDLHLEQTASETPHRLVTDTSPFQPARAVRAWLRPLVRAGKGRRIAGTTDRRVRSRVPEWHARSPRHHACAASRRIAEVVSATIAILHQVLLRCVQIMCVWMTRQRRDLHLLPHQTMNRLLHRPTRSRTTLRWARR
jgi:hypothetical protein